MPSIGRKSGYSREMSWSKASDQSKQQQFGGQIVFASSQLYDDSIIGRLSNIETRNVGQGLKLGKYPIHFHMVGNVSKLREELYRAPR